MIVDVWQSALTFAFWGFLLLPARKLSPPLRLAALAALLGAAFVPVYDLPLCAYLRGVTDDLAITTMLWMGWVIAGRIRGVASIAAPQRLELILCFALLGLLLYPLTLGLTDWDPYRLGYMPRPLLLGVGVLALVLWLRRNHVGVFILTGATVVFLINAKTSDNYWDYLVDPFLVLYCWIAAIAHLRQPLMRILRAPFAYRGRVPALSRNRVRVPVKVDS